MRPTEKIKKLFVKSNVTVSSELDDKIINDAFQVLEKSIKTKSAEPEPNIWRIIMKSRITKIAAAAVIIIAVLIGISHFSDSVDIAGKAYGITDVPELYSSANTIHIKRYFGNIKLLGEKKTTLRSEDWIDIENGRFRTSGFGRVVLKAKDKEERSGTVGIEFIFDGNYRIQINHGLKVAQFYKLSDFKRRLSMRKQIDRFLEKIFLSSDELAGYVKVGQEQIDSNNFDIWEKNSFDIGQRSESITKYWLSPSDGELKKVQRWRRSEEPNGEWFLAWEEQIERNAVPPEGIFEAVAPENYRLANTKETAFVDKLIAYPIRDNANSAIAIVIVLPNGIVTMGWNDKDVTPESPKAESIRSLEIGGVLPEMPVEINLTAGSPSISPMYTDLKVTHVARHLAYTQKEDKFYEWTIYVPKENIPSQTLPKDCLLNIRFFPELQEDREHPKHPKVAEMSSYLRNRAITVKAHEFDEWVLGAMSELSEDGKAPEDITYEKVLQLAEQIWE